MRILNFHSELNEISTFLELDFIACPSFIFYIVLLSNRKSRKYLVALNANTKTLHSNRPPVNFIVQFMQFARDPNTVIALCNDLISIIFLNFLYNLWNSMERKIKIPLFAMIFYYYYRVCCVLVHPLLVLFLTFRTITVNSICYYSVLYTYLVHGGGYTDRQAQHFRGLRAQKFSHEIILYS